MEVGDAHRHQRLRLCEVHGSLVSADDGADGIGMRRAVRRLGVSFGARGYCWSRGAELGGRIDGATRGSRATSRFFSRSDLASTPDVAMTDVAGAIERVSCPKLPRCPVAAPHDPPGAARSKPRPANIRRCARPDVAAA